MNEQRRHRLICEMLKSKMKEMSDFLNQYMSQDERNRIGEDIMRIMPSEADLAKVEMEILAGEKQD